MRGFFFCHASEQNHADAFPFRLPVDFSRFRAYLVERKGNAHKKLNFNKLAMHHDVYLMF